MRFKAESRLLVIKIFLSLGLAHPLVAQSDHLGAENASDGVAQAFMNSSYYEKGHGIIIAMPKVFELAAWLFPSTFGTNGEELGPLNLFQNPIFNVLDAHQRVAQRYGFTLLNFRARSRGIDQNASQVVGLMQTRFNQRQVFVAGCAACHSAKAAGRYYVGLGSKNIDSFAMSSDSIKILNYWGAMGVSRSAQTAYENSLVFSKLASTPEISNLSQGLVPTSLIKSWVYRELNLPFPFPGVQSGVVKPPHLWGLKAKKQVGFSANGEGHSQEGWNDGLGWMMGAEMMVSGPGANHILESKDRLVRMFELTQKIEPPRYPFSIDLNRAQQGKFLFQKSCISCHQSHERSSNGEPIYLPPKRVKISVVKTDSARALSIGDGYRSLVAKTAWNQFVPLQAVEAGYLAPQLWGIWSRFPYLHNASVPTLFDLLQKPEARPVSFSLVDAGEEYRFDSKKVGLTPEPTDGVKNKRAIRDTRLPEQSNQGHFFSSMEKLTDEDRFSIIEYLKTL